MTPDRPGHSPAPPSPRKGRALLLLPLGAVVLLALAGCAREDVSQYTVPRDKAKVRLLAAIVIDGKDAWFVKFVGPEKKIDEQAATFDSFVRSFRFKKGAERALEWQLPDGWEDAGPSGSRYATLYAGKKGDAPQITVSKLRAATPPDKGPAEVTDAERRALTVLSNVNRWRLLDLSLPVLDEDNVKDVTRSLTVNGKDVVVVDMRGEAYRTAPGKAPSPPMGHPPFAGGKFRPDFGPGRKPADLPFTSTAPSGWKQKPGNSVVVAAFTVPAGDQQATLTITPLSRAAGGLVLANVNRWRNNDFRLPPVTEADPSVRNVKSVKVDGADAKYYDLSGADKRILAVSFVRGDTAWFVKLIGPAPAVARSKSDFDTFIGTVKFRGGRGASDE